MRLRAGACPQTEDDEDDGDDDEGEDNDDDEDDDEDGTEDDLEDGGSPSQRGEESKNASASQLPQTALPQSLQQYLQPPAGPLFGLGQPGPIQGATPTKPVLP